MQLVERLVAKVRFHGPKKCGDHNSALPFNGMDQCIGFFMEVFERDHSWRFDITDASMALLSWMRPWLDLEAGICCALV